MSLSGACGRRDRRFRAALTTLIALWLLGRLALASMPAAAAPEFLEVFATQGVPSLLIDPASGRIVAANPAAEKYYGHPRATLLAMTIQEINLFTPEQVAAERELAASEGRNYFIFRHRLGNGEIRLVEVHSQPIDFSGQKLLYSLVHDITPNRHTPPDLAHYQQRLEATVDAQTNAIAAAEQRQSRLLVVGLLVQGLVIALLIVSVRRHQRLERNHQRLLIQLRSRNAELSRLGEAMAHHFQEPARRLMSFARRLREKSALAGDPDSRIALDFIDAQAQRMSALIRDVQRYLAIEHLASATATVNSGQIVTEVIAEFGERAIPPRAEVFITTPLPAVWVQPELLRGVFSILIDNALRYAKAGRTAHIEISCRVAFDRAHFRVADDGCGILPEYREQVFELFTRLVPSSEPGTGVGLAMLRKSIYQAGGSIHIEDGPDGGACFVFDLPIEEAS